MKELIGIFFNRVFGLTALGLTTMAAILGVYGVLQDTPFREVAVAVVLAVVVLLAAASPMGSANESEIIKRLD